MFLCRYAHTFTRQYNRAEDEPGECNPLEQIKQTLKLPVDEHIK